MVYKLITTTIIFVSCFFIYTLLTDLEEAQMEILGNTVDIMHLKRTQDSLIKNQMIIIKRIVE